MLQEEAKWLGDFISSLGEEYFPMLNIGSSTARYRKTIQPYIDSELFVPLQRQMKQVGQTKPFAITCVVFEKVNK